MRAMSVTIAILKQIGVASSHSTQLKRQMWKVEMRPRFLQSIDSRGLEGPGGEDFSPPAKKVVTLSVGRVFKSE
jgi:hypothetical protein